MPFQSGQSGNPNGRPLGSKNKENILKYKIKNSFTREEILDLVEMAKKKAVSSEKMLIFLLEQVFGKARQNLGMDGGDSDKPIIIQVAKELLEKYEAPSEPSENSEGQA